MKTAADAAGKREEIRGVDEVKNQMIYRRALKLAIPMMIGPGGISTVIIYSSQVSGVLQVSAILIAGLFISLFCYLALMAAGRISRLLGDTGLNIMSRIMGMLLAAVSVEIIVNALRTLFPSMM